MVDCAKMAQLIEMPRGRQTRVDPTNHVLYGIPDPPWEGAFWRMDNIGSFLLAANQTSIPTG